MQHLSSHKRLITILSFLILSFFCLLYVFHKIHPTERDSYHTSLLEEMEQASSFSEFTDALFRYEVTSDSITTAYTLKDPSSYGIPKLPSTLTTFTFSGYEKQKKEQSDEKTLSFLSHQLERFDCNTLDKQEQITYSLLQKQFDLNKQLCAYAYYEDLLGSSSGVQAKLPVTLGEYPLHNEENIRTYLSLLSRIPEYFHHIIAYEKHRAKLGYTTPSFLLQSTKDGLETMLEGFEQEDNCLTETFEQRLREISELSKKKRSAYCNQNKKAVQKYILPAYRELLGYVDSLLATTSINITDKTSDTTSDSSSYSVNQEYIPAANTPYGLSTLPNGAAYYDLLVKSNTGTDRSVPELIQMTEETLKQTLGNVLQITLTDQPAYLYYVDHPLETCYESPQGILEALSLMMRKDYPPLAKTPAYRIKSVPDSLATSLSPAFYMIPAIDDYENNTIYINKLYTSKEKGNLFTTLAHEGFPGHLYQTVYFNNTNPLLIRHLLDYPGYVEGWATYVEINSFHFLKYPLKGDSLCKLYQSDTIMNLALCSRIDMGVNYENWTIEDVDKLFKDNGFNSYYAPEVYAYVVESPAVYLRYFIGYLEILECKDKYRRERTDGYSESDFHKSFLDVGPGDFETILNYIQTN